MCTLARGNKRIYNSRAQFQSVRRRPLGLYSFLSLSLSLAFLFFSLSLSLHFTSRARALRILLSALLSSAFPVFFSPFPFHFDMESLRGRRNGGIIEIRCLALVKINNNLAKGGIVLYSLSLSISVCVSRFGFSLIKPYSDLLRGFISMQI